MLLSQLSIQRYRSILKTEKLGLKQLTVLVGPNNEGKSNILQALVTGVDILSRGEARVPVYARRRRGARLEGGYDWERDYPLALQESDPTGSSVLSFDFTLDDSEVTAFEAEVGSRLNGILPVSLEFGPDSAVKFSVRKQRHSAALSAKRDAIATFLASRIQLQYIPAARTSEAALQVIDQMMRQVLRGAARDPAYRDALEKVAEVQQPLLDELAESIRLSLQQLLPEVREVKLEQEDRPSTLGRARVIVDDGNPTDLELKGDGVQSLAALSLIRFQAERTARDRHIILAVEEPEAHLHPKAIHEVRDVLLATAERQQVVIATHSPLLVNRFDLASNILVEKTKARPAGSVKELREMLGVRVSDNLSHAEVVLVVEGPEDNRAISAVIAHRSARLRNALRDGILGTHPMWGGAKLTYVLSQLQLTLCRPHVFVDDDDAGREAVRHAMAENLLTVADQTFARYPGAKESEFEDMVTVDVYESAFARQFQVDPARFSAIPRSKGKWSQRMRLAFLSEGKPWDSGVEAQVKALVAREVELAPGQALEPSCEPIIEALVRALVDGVDATRP